MSYQISADDQKWIDLGSTQENKDARKMALLNLVEMNGLKYEAGIGKSYIPEKNYYILFNDSALTADANELYEKALNFVALGGGVGGLAGSGVRWGLRKYFAPDREAKSVVKLDESCDEALKAYNAFSSNRKEAVPFWTAQAHNVLGLAGAIFNREMHHWNAENTKPQQALLGALNQTDEIPEQEYRKLFYLAIHPVPLHVMENLRQDIVNGAVPGISDAVAARCRSAPAGQGDVHATAQGAIDLRTEVFYNSFGNHLKAEIEELVALNSEIVANAGQYHAFASAYKLKRVNIDKAKYKRAMVCSAAFIIVHVKGSLAQSAALKKFKNSNLRLIQKWITAYEAEANTAAKSLEELGAD